MPSSPVPAASTPSPYDQPGDASAVGSPVRAAVPSSMHMDIDPPSSSAVVDVLPTSKPTGGVSDVAPVSDSVPEVSADNVDIAMSTSLEPTSSVEKAITPPGSDEAANAAITLLVQSAEVDRPDNQPGLSSVVLFSRVHRENDPGD
jgi:hypothetical protein